MPHAQVPVHYGESSTESSQSSDNQVPPSQYSSSLQYGFYNEREDETYDPTQAYLLPIALPPIAEPCLDELLRRVTGSNDLQNVEAVKMRVISDVVSLSRLSVFLPNLSHLDLSGSVLYSLRDLGCELVHLTHLNVSKCGLSSFDGTSGLPMVEVIIADDNMVQVVGALADLSLLKRLSARNNRICDLSILTFLGLCPNLIEVELQGNPVTYLILYRCTMRRNVKRLELLDGLPFSDDEKSTNFTTSDNSSSTNNSSLLSDEILSDFSEHDFIGGENVTHKIQLSASLNEMGSKNSSAVDYLRSTTDFSSQGSAVVGSLLGLARKRRQHQDSSRLSLDSASVHKSLARNIKGIQMLPPLNVDSMKNRKNVESSTSSSNETDNNYH